MDGYSLTCYNGGGPSFIGRSIEIKGWSRPSAYYSLVQPSFFPPAATSSLFSPYSSTFSLWKKAHPIVSNSNCEKVFLSPMTTSFARDLGNHILPSGVSIFIVGKLFEITRANAWKLIRNFHRCTFKYSSLTLTPGRYIAAYNLERGSIDR